MTAAAPHKLQRFKEAMRLVYGNFDSPPSPYMRAIASASSSSSLSSLTGSGGNLKGASSSAPAASGSAPPTDTTTSSASGTSTAARKYRDTLTPPPTSPLGLGPGGTLPPWAEIWNPPSHPGAGGHRGRYLWTDAFGVANLLTLWRESGNGVFLVLAKRLVRRVHDVLGRERVSTKEAAVEGGHGEREKNYREAPNQREEYPHLPGATDSEPLKGGLRIGKMDAGGEDGDGMYHHYITLWAFALAQLGLATGEGEWIRLAGQLLGSVHQAFVRREGDSLRMVWKVSTDMKTVLVNRTGHLDAVTGLGVVRFVRAAGRKLGLDGGQVGLEMEEGEYIRLVREEVAAAGGHMRPSSDLLDLGMGLWVVTLPGLRGEEWVPRFVEESLRVARRVMRRENGGVLTRTEGERLAFREFGAVMGLKCYLGEEGEEGEEGPGGDKEFFLERGSEVLRFWEDFMGRSEDEEFEPISLVMYAAALVPGAFRHDYFDAT